LKAKLGKKSVVVSNDADFHQLLEENTKIYDPRQPREGKGNVGFVVLKNKKAKYGVIKAAILSYIISNSGETEKIKAADMEAYVNERPELLEQLNQKEEELEKDLSKIFLLEKITAGDTSDNISSIIPNVNVLDTDVNIQFGEKTSMRLLTEYRLNNPEATWDEIMIMLIDGQAKKLHDKIISTIKTSFKEEGLKPKEVKAKLEETDLSTIAPSLEDIVTAITFIYKRNVTLVDFNYIDSDIQQQMEEYDNNLVIQNNTNVEISQYLKQIGLDSLSKRYANNSGNNSGNNIG
jgi:hypothetical protein